MGKNLMIVESPGKIDMIQSVLGSGWIIIASNGHVRDLPKTDLGFNLETLRPSYIETKSGKKVLAQLRKHVGSVDDVYLATDLDREGESIAWHIKDALNLDRYKRVHFKEITKKGILEGVQQPRKLDMGLVKAGLARRLLDRMVGYMVSPELSNEFGIPLSAGRVIIPAAMLIALKEREIKKFVPKDYFNTLILVESSVDNKGIKAQWNWKKYVSDNDSLDSKMSYWEDRSVCEKVATVNTVNVLAIEKEEDIKKAPAPFTTSTMQQEASNLLKINPKSCMSLAQKLYDAGLITYHRTDSINIASEAVEQIRCWLVDNGFEKFKPHLPNVFDSKKGASEAHEAIRPSDINLVNLDQHDARVNALYRLIWMRTVVSQMKSARFNMISVDFGSVDKINGYNVEFVAKARALEFAGWLRLTQQDTDKKREVYEDLDQLSVGDVLGVLKSKVESKETKPPARYTDASLIKKLESEGIGRPSTYATISDSIEKKKYAFLAEGKYVATDLGINVTEKLSGNFEFAELGYTKLIEESLDGLVTGGTDYHELMRSVYSLLLQELEEFTEIRIDLDECPKCGGDIVKKSFSKGKSAGKEYLGCSNYPKCDFFKWANKLKPRGF